MPTGVTLRGDWKQPTATDQRAGGAILAIDYAGAPFLGVHSGASVDGLTFWYPHQSLMDPVKGTAVAILPAGKRAGGKAQDTTSVTLRNLDIVNAWTAIDLRPRD